MSTPPPGGDWSLDGDQDNCGKCDEPMLEGEETLLIRGLTGYGHAHRDCLPDDYVEPEPPADFNISHAQLMDEVAEIFNQARPPGRNDDPPTPGRGLHL